MRFNLQDSQDTMLWGRTFGALLHPGDVVALIGDLGSGKTTLTQAIGEGLDVTDLVTSPTFALIQEYAGRTPMYHVDPYRLDSPEEIFELGLDEYLQRDGVIVVEWADLISPLLPEDRFEIRIEILSMDRQSDDGESSPRDLSIKGLGPHTQAVVGRLVNLPGVVDLISKIEANSA